MCLVRETSSTSVFWYRSHCRFPCPPCSDASPAQWESQSAASVDMRSGYPKCCSLRAETLTLSLATIIWANDARRGKVALTLGGHQGYAQCVYTTLEYQHAHGACTRYIVRRLPLQISPRDCRTYLPCRNRHGVPKRARRQKDALHSQQTCLERLWQVSPHVARADVTAVAIVHSEAHAQLLEVLPQCVPVGMEHACQALLHAPAVFVRPGRSAEMLLSLGHHLSIGRRAVQSYLSSLSIIAPREVSTPALRM